MPEYIEREIVLEALQNSADHYAAIDQCTEEAIRMCMRTIQKIPAADVVEVVRHGRWELMQYEGGILDGTTVDRCSCCGWERVFSDARLKVPFWFCPGCGAKMDGGDDHAAD